MKFYLPSGVVRLLERGLDVRNLAYLGNVPARGTMCEAAIRLADRPGGIDRDCDPVQAQCALAFLRLMGCGWDGIEKRIPGAARFFEERSGLQGTLGLERGWFGYPWSAARDKRGELSCAVSDFSRLFAPESRRRILNPMTGSGDEAIFLAERYPHLEIVCFDLNPSNLLDAIRRAREKKIPPKRIPFLFHDARDRLPFDEGYFDGVLVNNYSTVGFTEEALDSFFGEVLRVCGNGARVWIDAFFYENPMLLAQFGRQITRFTRLASSRGIGLTSLDRPVLRGASGTSYVIYEVVKG